MRKSVVAGVVCALAVLVMWFQLESRRGSFDAVERLFLSWLAANTGTKVKLPPLTLVLYDEEASELAGTPRMAMLDGALFTRAASKLGAVAAGVEGLSGDPARMIQAAEGMPVFGGYLAEQPPGLGWSPLGGVAVPSWSELSGLAGRGGRFARGFIMSPTSQSSVRAIQLVARCADRPVPSLLLVAWSITHGWRMSELSIGQNFVAGPHERLMVDETGKALFMPARKPAVMTMNELLVASEKFEREGGVSPLRDRLLVLARATPDVPRLTGEGAGGVTPMELWASSWEALRTGRLFLPAGWWYGPLLVLVGSLLAFSPARSSNLRVLGFFLLAMLVYLFVALATFAHSRVLLPFGPTLLTLAAGSIMARLGHLGGWFKK